MFRIVSLACFLALTFGAHANHPSIPHKEFPDDVQRDYWLPEQVNLPEVVVSFQETVSAPSQTITPDQLTLDGPVEIALVYPSADVSDFWVRNYAAMTHRLEELGIAFNTTEFTSRQIEHSLQTRQTNEVLNRKGQFDFVIFGPTELDIQAKNIQRLAASDAFSTFVWAFHTPKKNWAAQPDMWLDFSSASGALTMCHYLIGRLGQGVSFALNRGILGITDDQRSGDFANCVEQEGDWFNSYEHFGQYQKQGGADGFRLIDKNFPEVTVLHNANTAMAMGVVEARAELDSPAPLFVTGWGGTAKELEKIRTGELNATPMRMSDDVGVATAEAIKLYLMGKSREVPKVYLGRITIANDTMTDAELDGLEKEAFRYSEPLPAPRPTPVSPATEPSMM